MWITTNCGKFLKCEYQTTLPALGEICIQVKKKSLEPVIEQWPGSKSGKEYVKAMCCHPAYVTLMQNVCVCVLSVVRLLVIPWTVRHQAPLSMGFPRQEYWSGLSFPSPGDFLTQGSNLGLPHNRQMLYPLSHQGSAECII